MAEVPCPISSILTFQLKTSLYLEQKGPLQNAADAHPVFAYHKAKPENIFLLGSTAPLQFPVCSGENCFPCLLAGLHSSFLTSDPGFIPQKAESVNFSASHWLAS